MRCTISLLVAVLCVCAQGAPSRPTNEDLAQWVKNGVSKNQVAGTSGGNVDLTALAGATVASVVYSKKPVLDGFDMRTAWLTACVVVSGVATLFTGSMLVSARRRDDSLKQIASDVKRD